MKSPFEKYLQQADSFVYEVARVTGEPTNISRAIRIIVALFRSLRERISPEESMQLVAQLPMILKAVYVDGWKLSKKSESGDMLFNFLDDVRKKCGPSGDTDLGNDTKAAMIIQNVLGVLRNYVSEGEFQDIRAQLPAEVAQLFERIEA